MAETKTGGLQRHFGLLHATALNVTMIVGAGVFVTIPLMLKELPGPYAILGWLGAGALMLVDGYRDRPWGWLIYDVCVASIEGAVHHASARRFRTRRRAPSAWAPGPC